MTLDPSRSFLVIVHDVAPVFARQTAVILEALAPRIGGRAAAAVTPCWRGMLLEPERDSAFLTLVASRFGEILLHGWNHHQPRMGLIAALSGRSNEMSGLPIAEARDRLVRGKAVLEGIFGTTVDGFVPPAWRPGRLTAADLSWSGFERMIGFDAARTARGEAIPLSTWSWDWGPIGTLGIMGEPVAAFCAMLRPTALPSVAIHPADVDRGCLPRCLKVVDRLRREGRSAVLPEELSS